MKIDKDKNLREFNSFKVNVKSTFFLELFNKEDFYEFFKIKDKLPAPFYILGGGNNTLFINDFNGTIIKISNKSINIIRENENEVIIEVSAGIDWNDMVKFSLEEGYFGLENLIDIPGQMGSAPIQNIGAYGAEVKDVIQSVDFFDLKKGIFKTYSHEECQFDYRSSIFKNKLKGKGIIASVKIKLSKKGDLKFHYGNIQKRLKEKGISKPTQGELANCISEIRSAKLPDPKEIGNAGSFFKNPILNLEQYQKLIHDFPEAVCYELPNKQYKVAAGWLIDKAGWKGKSIGNAAVHSKQALVLINKTGKATGIEILELAQQIIENIKQIFGIDLIPEVNIISQ